MIKNTIAKDLDDCRAGFLSPDTECLIKYKGWTTYDKIEIGDLICSMNATDRAVSWQAVSNVVTKDGEHEMFSYNSSRFSFSTTKDNNLFGWHAHSACSVTGSPDYIVAADVPFIWNFAICGSLVGGTSIANGLAKLAGLIMSDGSFHISKRNNPKKLRNTIIYQSKDPEPIRQVLRDADMIWSEKTRTRNIKVVCGKTLIKPPLPERSFYLSHLRRTVIDNLIETRDRLPKWAWDCDSKTFNELLDGFLLGDGSIYSFPRVITTRILYGKKAILDDIQGVALNHGWTASISQDNRGAYRLNLCKNPIRSIFRRQMISENHTGTVWNIIVPQHCNFLSRRNGKSSFACCHNE